MAYEDQQPEFPVGDNSKKSSRFLPRYFRTSTNEKLTSSTIDQLFSSGAVEKINAFVGRRNAKANANNSTYLTEINSLRSNSLSKRTRPFSIALAVSAALDRSEEITFACRGRYSSSFINIDLSDKSAAISAQPTMHLA